MTIDADHLKKAIKYVTANEEALRHSHTAACYFCCQIYPAKDVIDFLEQERTALCPKCGVDSVLPDSAGYPFDDDTLQKLHQHWFEEGRLGQTSS